MRRTRTDRGENLGSDMVHSDNARAGSSTSQPHKVVIISPCRDEAATVEKTIASMEAQSVPPVRWVVVDDGSTDDTLELLESAARRIPWLHVVRREDRGFRKVGGGVIEAFEYNNPTSDKSFGAQDVSKVYMMGSYHQAAEFFEVIFNKTK